MPRTTRLRNAAFTVLFAALFLTAAFASSSSTGDDAHHAARSSGAAAYSHEAAKGVQALQRWYKPDTGLYQSPTGWWNAANAITVLVNYSRATHTTQYLQAVANTFAHANSATGSRNFVTSANDDEGWWALAWIDAYDLTGKQSYLATARTIFADMTTQWDTSTCGGGVWWSKNLKTSAYKNAITNELFLTIAASLANRTPQPGQKARYLHWAVREWQWFDRSGMINAQHLVNDGLNARNPAACVNNGETTWTYNQGVVLGGLLELYRANHDHSLIASAQKIAAAATTHLVNPAGILREPRPTISGPDVPQFKGIFIRNLMELDQAFPTPRDKALIDRSAQSILQNDRGPNDEWGAYWQGPFDSGDATRQTSALDAIIAAIAIRR